MMIRRVSESVNRANSISKVLSAMNYFVYILFLYTIVSLSGMEAPKIVELSLQKLQLSPDNPFTIPLFDKKDTLSGGCFLGTLSSSKTNNGGFLPYYIDNKGEIHFLLGSEYRDTLKPINCRFTGRAISGAGFLKPRFCFSDFGGDLELSPDEKDAHKIVEACLRETYEELHIVFPQEAIMDQVVWLKYEDYTLFLIRLPKQISLDLLPRYVISFDYDDGNFIFEAFPRKDPVKEFAFNEKNKYGWFNKAAILAFINIIDNEYAKEAKGKESKVFNFNKIIQNDHNSTMLLPNMVPVFKFLFANEFLFQKIKPVTCFYKWFKVLYCLLYVKKDNNQYNLYSDKEEGYCFYWIDCVYDTKKDFYGLFEGIEKKIHSVKYDTTDMAQFLKNIYFSINTSEQTAYCALEIQKPLDCLPCDSNIIFKKSDCFKTYCDYFINHPNNHNISCNVSLQTKIILCLILYRVIKLCALVNSTLQREIDDQFLVLKQTDDQGVEYGTAQLGEGDSNKGNVIQNESNHIIQDKSNHTEPISWVTSIKKFLKNNSQKIVYGSAFIFLMYSIIKLQLCR